MKKFLSMVLALAMAMSLVTFAAPAAGARSFTDDGSIQYKQAVDVISAIQIMDGYADASFNPSGTLTRGAAAKIICNMILGPTTAAALPTNVNPFPDVTSDNVFAGYIAYCSEHQIISGYADGNFRPAGSLSGYAFLKMLLCALGYDQEIEGYQGANWRVNVAKQALGIKLDAGLVGDLDGSRIVTREEAALYAFNTLQADMVEYDTKTSVAVNGATVTVGGNTYHTKTSSTQATRNQNIDARAVNNGMDFIVQFAEEYFPNLRRNPTKDRDFDGGQDAFGRPSTTWIYKGVEIGTYKVNPAKTYYGDIKVTDIYNDLNLAGTAEDAKVYLNGQPVFDIDIKRSNGDKLHEQTTEAKVSTGVGGANYVRPTAANGVAAYDAKVGDGTIIEVFHDDDTNKIVICAISVYAGEIDSVHARTSTKDAYVVVSEKKNNATEDANAFSRSGHDEYTTDETYSEDDKVWFTYSAKDHEIGEIHRMESVEGSLTRRVATKSLTLDGVKYDFGKEYALDMLENDLSNTSNYVIFRDGQGYVLWVEESSFAVDRYGIIQRISVEGSAQNVLYRYIDANGDAASPAAGTSMTSWDGSRVRLLLSNGAERNYDLDESNRYRVTTTVGAVTNESINAIYDAGQVVRFTENSDGTVRLYSAGAMPGAATGTIKTANTMHNGVAGTALANVGTFQILNHVMSNLYRENGDGSITEVRADSDTVFVIKDPDGVKTYTGLRNAPDVRQRGTTSVNAYAYINANANNPTAKLVYVIVGNANDIESSSKDITFLTNPSDVYQDDAGAPYVEYTAIIKGVVQTNPVCVYTSTALVGAKDDLNEINDGNAPSVDPSSDFRTGSIILNKTTYDNDDFMTAGSFQSRTMQSNVAQGIKKTSRSDEIKLDEHSDSFTATVASGANIFYVDGDGVASKITVSDIRNDTDDMVYYTVDEDGDINNLFIVDYEDDNLYIATASVDTVNNRIVYTWNSTDINDQADAKWRGTVAGATAKTAAQLAADIARVLNFNTSYRNVSYNSTTGTIDGSTTGNVPFSIPAANLADGTVYA